MTVENSNLEQLSFDALQAKNYIDAENLLLQAINLNNNNPKLFYNLGYAQKNLNKLDDAVNAYQKAITLDPGYQDAYINLGNVYTLQTKHQDAINTYLSALKINPDNALVHYNLGYQYKHLHNIKEATQSYRKVIELQPTALAAVYNLAQLLIEQSNTAEASYLIEQGLKHNAKFAPLYRLASLCQHYDNADHPHIQLILNLLNTADITQEDLCHLYYALGKIHDDLKKYKQAFQYYLKANEIKNILEPFDLAAHLKLTDEIIHFEPISYALKASALSPIFIIGMPCSGKSILEKMLAMHSEIYPYGDISIEPYLENLSDFQKRLAKESTDINLTKTMFTLTAFRNVYYLKTILLLFPKAKILYCKRGHMDTCLKAYFHYFENNQKQTHDLRSLALFHRDFDILMQYWKKEFRDKIFTLQYEDLVKKPDDVLNAIYQFLHLKPETENLISLKDNEIGYWKYYAEYLHTLEDIFKLPPAQLKLLLHQK